jgi:hypothetical protein
MPLCGPCVDGTRLSVDGVDIRQTDHDLTLVLSAAGAQVMLVRLRYDGWVDELINAVGSIAPGPGAWTLIDRDLSLEIGSHAAATLGFPRDFGCTSTWTTMRSDGFGQHSWRSCNAPAS